MVKNAVLAFCRQLPYTNVWTLVLTLGTTPVIVFARSKSMMGRIQSLRLFVFIGLISYSTVLWHQPVFTFARNCSNNHANGGYTLYRDVNHLTDRNASALVDAFMS